MTEVEKLQETIDSLLTTNRVLNNVIDTLREQLEAKPPVISRNSFLQADKGVKRRSLVDYD